MSLRPKWNRPTAITLSIARKIYRKSVAVVRYFLGIDGQTFAFVTKVLGLLIYLYWVSVGLIYEATRFNRYDVNLFEFAVIEDIIFVTAKTWFLFFMPFIVPLVACFIISVLLLIIALILSQIGKSLRLYKLDAAREWKKYPIPSLPKSPQRRKLPRTENPSSSVEFQENIFTFLITIEYLFHWAGFVAIYALSVLSLRVWIIVHRVLYFVINCYITGLNFLKILRFYIVRLIRRAILTSARTLAAFAYILVGLTFVSPQIIAYLLADKSLLGCEVTDHFVTKPMIGTVCKNTPSQCLEGAEHIGSTRNYVMFMAMSSEQSGNNVEVDKNEHKRRIFDECSTAYDHEVEGRWREIVVIPRSNLSSFETSQLAKEVHTDGQTSSLWTADPAVTRDFLIGQKMEEIARTIREVERSMQRFEKVEAAIGRLESKANGQSTGLTSVANSVKTTMDSLVVVSNAVKETTGSLVSVTGSVEKTAGTLTSVSNAVKDTTGSLVSVTGSVEKTAGTLTSVSDAVKDTTGSLVSVTGSVEKTAGTLTSVSDAVKDTTGSLVSVTGSVERTADSLVSVTGVVEKTAGDLTSMSDAVKTTSNTLVATAKSVERTSRVLTSVSDSMAALKTAMETDTGKTTEEITTNLKAVNEMIGKLPRQIMEFPMRQYVIVDSSRARTVYAVWNYDTGQYVLKPSQREWLAGFFKSLAHCGKENPPKIHLSGLASSQNYASRSRPTNRENLCHGPERKSISDMSPREKSEYYNCYLANERVAEVASFLKFLQKRNNEVSTNEYQDIDYSRTFQNSMNEINSYCKMDREKDLTLGLQNITINPWCNIKEMKDRRRGDFDDFHVLNRSVHLEVVDAGSCKHLSDFVTRDQ